jgi:hypothetical protein
VWSFRCLRSVRAPAALALLVLGAGVLSPGGEASAARHGYDVQPLPNPPGASNAALYGISCPEVAGCVGVGYATTSPSGALVETYDDGTWTPTVLEQGLSYPSLSQVWCASLTSCVAVGAAGPLEANGDDPLVESLSGGTWTPTSPALPTGAVTGLLDAISCLTPESCVAAGFFGDDEGDTHALFEVLSHGAWTPEVGSDPSPSSTQEGIKAVQCFTATSCDAVGFFGGISSSNGLLETFSGTKWTGSALGGTGILNSLSCVSSTSCLAVGSSLHGGGYTETLSATTWTRGRLPMPGGGGVGKGIAGVSCPRTVSSCVAMGGWRPPQHLHPLLLIETESHGTWAADEIPAPSGSMAAEAIACPTVSTCIGVGRSSKNGGPAEVAVEQSRS